MKQDRWAALWILLAITAALLLGWKGWLLVGLLSALHACLWLHRLVLKFPAHAALLMR